MPIPFRAMFALAFASSIAALSPAGTVVAQTWPTKAWPLATPKALGINAAVLDSIDGEIASGRYGLIDRMLVIRHGKVAFDKSYTQDYAHAYRDSVNTPGALNPHDPGGPYNYYNPWWHPYYHGSNLHSLQSVTKTMTSVIFGVAITRGDFPGIDRTVLSFFDSGTVANVDDRKRRMTVRNLLDMTGGFDWNENLPYADPRNSATLLEASSDWVKFVMDRPMSDDPGTRFNYNSGATEILAYIFRRGTGRDIEEYAAQYLFAPLGIDRWFWKRIPTGLADTEGGLYLEARDLAKVWYLFLHDGMWDGKRIVSPEWVKASLTPSVPTGRGANPSRYSLAWWFYPTAKDSTRFYYSGSGFGGQIPAMLKEQDIVVVFNAWNILPGRGNLPGRRMLDRIAAAAAP